MTLGAGEKLGPYEILERVGKGGMATVYRARQLGLEREVALKVLPDFFAQDGALLERFRREAVAVARLRHPNILSVFDYGETGGVNYIASEFVSGGTLADRMGATMEVDEVVTLLGPIADALDYAHGQGVLHRDVKPSNVLIDEDGTPYLSDFGLARMLESGQSLTAAGTTLGTPEYMAPEQCAGGRVGPAADQYSLALVAYQMLTGRVAFQRGHAGLADGGAGTQAAAAAAGAARGPAGGRGGGAVEGAGEESR